MCLYCSFLEVLPGQRVDSLPFEQVTTQNHEVYEWISERVGFTHFYSDGAQSHENQPNAKPSKVTQGRAQSIKVHTILESRSLENIHSRSLVHRLNRKKHVTVYIFSF